MKNGTDIAFAWKQKAIIKRGKTLKGTQAGDPEAVRHKFGPQPTTNPPWQRGETSITREPGLSAGA